MESDIPSFDTFPMRILPDTCVELVVHYNDPYKTTFSDNSSSIQNRSMIVAQMRSYLEILPHGKPGLIAVRFSAQGAYHFFGVPMKEIANGETPLNEVWSGLGTEIEEKIGEARNNQSRIDIIQQYLLLQLAKNGSYDQLIDYCLEEINNSRGQISMEELAGKTGVSNRQLLRKFNKCVGLPPKEFSKIVKFNNALNYLNRFPGRSFTDTAYDCGYFDQAHFIRDFKAYSGLTPSEYLFASNVVY